MSKKDNIKLGPIVTWKPDEEDIVVNNDGKLFIMYFDKAFGSSNLAVYNKFLIKKSSYEKQLDVICKYMNFFIKFYDTEYELPTAYLKLKYAIDKEKRFNEENAEQLIDLIYEFLFTDTMVAKIYQIVEDNYLDDIESAESKKYVMEKKHLESLEFTNQHIKILLRISFGMKVIAPILFHYVSINVIKLDKDSDLIYRFYRKLFDIFSDNVNIYNKLFTYVKAKVLESQSHNSLIYDQRDILGYDNYLVIHNFVRRVLISENVVKYRFNEVYDAKTGKFKENIVGFNKTIIKYQLMYFLKDQYSKNLTEVTSAKNAEGLSGMDKMEMNLSKLDEGQIILAEANVKREVERICKRYDFDITDEELQYYIKNHIPSELQAQLVYSYWGSQFGSYRNSNLISREAYIKLLLIMKKRLLLQAGCHNSDDFSEYTRLAYLLTGNVKDRVNTRLIRNNKFTTKVKDSYQYKHLQNKKYKELFMIKPDYIMSLLSQIINTRFT